MRTIQLPLTCGRVALFVIFATVSSFASGPVEAVVYSFLGSPDARNPLAGLVADSAGNLYGTTGNGGAGTCDCGTVFELNPPATAGGPWTETVLHSFQGAPYDGYGPFDSLILDKKGNLYGTTSGGGLNDYGIVFELSPPTTSGGSWTETVLWTFDPNSTGGYAPLSKLVMDRDGNLYGTTYYGPHNTGTVFELVKPTTSGGLWAERILHTFGTTANDGVNPQAGLLLRGGVLYGTTDYGGTSGNGIVFQLVRKPDRWTETVLYNFTGPGRAGNPFSGAELIADSAGNLYGTTYVGGAAACACGAIYELSPPTATGDPWQETTLYSFSRQGDGANPVAALWHDRLNNLYGTVSYGGTGFAGKLFKLKPPSTSGEAWTFSVLHNFGSAGDGISPLGTLILLNGVLYGTAETGGIIGSNSGGGVVFSFVP